MCYWRLIPKETPKADLGGKRRAVFGGYARSARSGSTLEVSQRLTFGLSSVGGALVRFLPIVGWGRTMTPEDV
jgi:hypothetical protein